MVKHVDSRQARQKEPWVLDLNPSGGLITDKVHREHW